MDSFKLSGADIKIRYHDNKLFVQGKGLPLISDTDEKIFSDNSIAKSGSDLGERMTVVLLDSSRNGTSFVLHLIVPKTSPSKEEVAINGAAILVSDFSNLVGGAPPVLQHYDVRPLTGTMFVG